MRTEVYNGCLIPVEYHAKQVGLWAFVLQLARNAEQL